MNGRRTEEQERDPDQDWQQEEPHEKEQQEEQHKKEEHIQERTAPAGEIVYHAVYREGEHELERQTRALMWSALAAGLSMGFSLLTEAFLTSYLPNTNWRPLLTKVGYSVGFLIVILGRQQLFTENTLTVILPLLKKREGRILLNVARLWAVVLVSNVVGALAFAVFLSKTTVLQSPMHGIIKEIGIAGLHPTFLSAMLNAIFAGWLIALMIWLLPFAESAKVWVIVLLSYIIGIGHLPHIIAGSVPTLYLLLTGSLSFGEWLKLFFVPTLVGNIIGGMAMVAMAV
ncbi:MAG: formate/nitrite transporter family protein, partial [Limisphaerales bacterium]